jgi:hypothetical protein
MKMSRVDSQVFKPYEIRFTVESEEEEEVLLSMAGLVIRIPDYLADIPMKQPRDSVRGIAKDFLDKLRNLLWMKK